MAIEIKEDGTIIVRTAITFKAGRDDDLIALIKNAPKRRIATAIREAMRSGVQISFDEKTDDDIDLSGLGEDL